MGIKNKEMRRDESVRFGRNHQTLSPCYYTRIRTCTVPDTVSICNTQEIHTENNEGEQNQVEHKENELHGTVVKKFNS